MPRYSLYLFAIVCLGFFFGLVDVLSVNFEWYSYFRDIIYHLSPLLYFLFSSMVGGLLRDENQLWTVLYIACAISSLAVVILGLQNFFLGFSLGAFTPTEASAIAIIIFCFPPKGWLWKEKQPISSTLLLIFSVISVCVSFSRSTLLTILVLLLIIGSRSFDRMLRFILVLGLSLVVFSITIPNDVINTFAYKIFNSFSEISGTHAQWNDISITHNWRGYENYVGFSTFQSSSIAEQIFGHGFGYKLDVGYYSNLVTNESGGLALLHNGYLMTLLKSGVVGLLLYLLFYVKNIVYYGRSWRRHHNYIDGMLLGLFISLLGLTYIINGLFTPKGLYTLGMPVGLLVGYLAFSTVAKGSKLKG